jgi:hypothetical protein
MKHCNKCNTAKPFTGFYKNKSKKDGYASICSACNKVLSNCWKEQHSAENRLYNTQWQQQNKDKKLHNHKKWRQSNPNKVSSYTALRRAVKLQATPKWLKEEHYKQIESFYWLAKLQCELTDSKYEVDHIVPLKGKTVCGLHVPWNLQILTERENRFKSNRI